MASGLVANMPSLDTRERLEIIKSHILFEGLSLSPTNPDQEWRTLPEVPSAEELNPDWNSPGVREKLQSNVKPNHVDVPWSSKDKYLEAHYRLQREEAMTMLRYSIRVFRDDPDVMDDEQTCIYTKVFVRGYLSTRLGAICRVQFSTERAGKRICWNQTRRLNPGSLVVLSTAKDQFNTICKPAIIADAYVIGGLDQNPPTIQFWWANPEDAVIDPSEELIMLESRFGYFEAVRHCMIGLQKAGSEETPIDKYLVNACQDDENAVRITCQPNLDYSPLIHHVEGEAQMMVGEREKALYEARARLKQNPCSALGSFPSEVTQFTTLDKSQLEAVQRICTKELAIVQGPPGTGKTFTSVQALQVLLESQTPGENVIVVAAQTNHAVDQILSYLVKDFRVVRLGGRAKSESIKQYSMYNLRLTTKGPKKDHEFAAIEAARLRNLKSIEKIIEEVFPQGLLSHEVLCQQGLITQAQFNSLENEDDWEVDGDSGRPSDIVAQWLGDQLMQVDQNKYKDPSFDMAEDDDFAEDDARAHDRDIGDGIDEQVEDEQKIHGIWTPITQRWTGYGSTSSTATITRELERAKGNLWNVQPQFRGSIYRYWQQELIKKRLPDFRRLMKDAERLSKNQKINRWLKDTEIIKQNSIEIIGCTTTGLTKYRGLIAALRPRTMLIEEAAETREANIMSALYTSLEQLILVGDHQQLAPSCDTPSLALPPYNLRVSMFERLVNLKLPFTFLNVQRRMIPKLREVLEPFYPRLRDHATVSKQAPVPGMGLESFFFHHTWVEDTDEDMSKFNIIEAEMIAYFVDYLTLNGTDRDKITVLTFYRGQQKKIRDECRKLAGQGRAAFHNVQTVDSYQGEENDVVILSLVRSQGELGPHNTGFVSDTNRGVVSISRARRGFYIFGNLLCLTGSREAAKTWERVYRVFLNQGRLGKDGQLPIVCKNHGKITYRGHPDDWVGAHGGCDKLCQQTLDCGHPCGRRCHPMEHSQLFCNRPCEKTLRCGHRCVDLCGDTCRCDCPNFTGLKMSSGPSQYSVFNPTVRQSQKDKNGSRSNHQDNYQRDYRGSYQDNRRVGYQTGNQFPMKTHGQRRGQTDGLTMQPHGGLNTWRSHNIQEDDKKHAALRRKESEALRLASMSSTSTEPIIRDTWTEINFIEHDGVTCSNGSSSESKSGQGSKAMVQYLPSTSRKSPPRYSQIVPASTTGHWPKRNIVRVHPPLITGIGQEAMTRAKEVVVSGQEAETNEWEAATDAGGGEGDLLQL